MRRSIQVVIVLSLIFVVSGHTPGAWACSCVGYGSEEEQDAQSFIGADVVFTGRVIDRDEKTNEQTDDGGHTVSGPSSITWTFDVDKVQKGSVADPEQVVTGGQGDTCGYNFKVGDRYQVYGHTSDSTINSGLCSGNRSLADDAAYRVNDPEPGARLVAAGGRVIVFGARTLPTTGVPRFFAVGVLLMLIASFAARILRRPIDRA